MYSTHAQFLLEFAELCSAIDRLPTSTAISTGLEKSGTVPVTSGGLRDIWRGEYDGKQVAIEAFRICPDENLREARKVRIERVQEVLFNNYSTDPMEIGRDVEEVHSSKCRPTSGSEHNALSAGACL